MLISDFMGAGGINKRGVCDLNPPPPPLKINLPFIKSPPTSLKINPTSIKSDFYHFRACQTGLFYAQVS